MDQKDQKRKTKILDYLKFKHIQISDWLFPSQKFVRNMELTPKVLEVGNFEKFIVDYEVLKQSEVPKRVSRKLQKQFRHKNQKTKPRVKPKVKQR